MEKFRKFSSRIVIFSALLWAVLMISQQLSVGQSYIGIGALSAYVGIQNLILLNWGQRTGIMPEKIAHLIKLHGNRRGIFQYVLVNILSFFVIGMAVVVCGWKLL